MSGAPSTLLALRVGSITSWKHSYSGRAHCRLRQAAEPRPAVPRTLGAGRGARGAADLLRPPRPPHGYQAGLHNGHPIIRHDLTQLGFNLVEGLSNGAIWALIAMGYTLVYGIIELINFAHGDVFTMGSFTAAGFWGTLGLGSWRPGPLGLIVGLLLTLVVAMLSAAR